MKQHSGVNCLLKNMYVAFTGFSVDTTPALPKTDPLVGPLLGKARSKCTKAWVESTCRFCVETEYHSKNSPWPIGFLLADIHQKRWTIHSDAEMNGVDVVLSRSQWHPFTAQVYKHGIKHTSDATFQEKNRQADCCGVRKIPSGQHGRYVGWWLKGQPGP
jgi:hypothetical protein